MAYYRYCHFLESVITWYGKALKTAKHAESGLIALFVLFNVLIIIWAIPFYFFKENNGNINDYIAITIVGAVIGVIELMILFFSFFVNDILEIFLIRRKINKEFEETEKVIKNEAPQLGKLIRYMEKVRGQLFPLPLFLIFTEKKEQCKRLKLYRTYSRKGYKLWLRVKKTNNIKNV